MSAENDVPSARYTITGRNDNNTDVELKMKAAKRQRIVILAGPHKTGSTSMQSFFVKWTKKHMLQGWIWPGGEKSYAPLVLELLAGNKNSAKRQRDTFREVWMSGSNIVFGAEALDKVTMVANESIPLIWHDSENTSAFSKVGNGGGTMVIDHLLKMMPWENTSSERQLRGSSYDVSVVVNYRTPRVGHLISVWKQHMFKARNLEKNIEGYSARNKEDMDPSFAEWICTSRWSNTMFDVRGLLRTQVNPLGVADEFRKKGLRTVLVDMRGVERSRLDLSSVVACEVLGLECKDGFVRGLPAKFTVKNHREESLDMEIEDLTEMDDILRRIDCNYKHLAFSPLVEILYPDNIFSHCIDEGISVNAAYSLLQDIGCRQNSSDLNSGLIHESRKSETITDMTTMSGQTRDHLASVQYLLVILCAIFPLALRASRTRKDLIKPGGSRLK